MTQRPPLPASPKSAEAPAEALAAPASNAEGVRIAPAAGRWAISALLSGRVLCDGEIVQLVLKPSLWFIPLSCLKFTAAVAIVIIVAALLQGRVPHYKAVYYIEAFIFVLAGRLMFAVLQWMGRLYILTDMRVLRLSGIFNVDIFDCPLRRVGRVQLVYTLKERLFRIGTVEISPTDSNRAPGVWQMIPKPKQVHEMLLAAVERARQSGHGSP